MAVSGWGRRRAPGPEWLRYPLRMTQQPGGRPRATPDYEMHEREVVYARRAGRGGEGAQWAAWSWSSNRGSFPWFGILLVALGLVLLVEHLVPELGLFTLLMLAAGLGLGAAWLLRGHAAATTPALVLVAWALSRMGQELSILNGEGWTPLLVGVALLATWGLARVQSASRNWALLIGAILLLIGAADVLDTLPAGVDLQIVVPLAVITLGAWLLIRSRLPDTS